MRKFSSAVEIAQRFEFSVGRHRSFLDRFRETNCPAGGFGHLFARNTRMPLGKGQFLVGGIGFHQTEISDYGDGALAGKTQAVASIAAVKVSDRSDEIEFFDKGAGGLLEDEHDLVCATGDFGSSTGPGQTRGGLLVIANDGGV